MKTYALRDSISKDVSDRLASYSPLEQALLAGRGVVTASDAEKFLAPHYERDTHDPFLMPDMDKAVDRVLAAMDRHEKICIYSDYDCDGVPGAVVLHDFFKLAGYVNFENYIPHRHLEGFGLNHEALEKISAGGAKLLITIDCGIADADEIDAMQKRGVDVIVTDHHEPGERLPAAFALVDPKLKNAAGGLYPQTELCGSGVVFKLVQGILKKRRFSIPEGKEKWLLDMVGIATCADMVPLVGENRALAYYGLTVLRKSPRPGLQKLLAKLGTNPRYLTEDDIGFTIGPRINAASRMGVPMDAFNLLATKDETEGGRLADHLNELNDERKGLVASMVKEIKKKISDREEEMKPVLVMGNPSWRVPLLGLAANTLMEEHSRPVFIWGRHDEETIKGSCRSEGSVSLIDLMQAAQAMTPGTFIEFGGHKCAGGFSVSHDKIHLLEDAIGRAHASLSKEAVEECIFMDAQLSLDDVNWKTYAAIDRMAPFGMGNAKPMFLFRQVAVEDVKLFGKTKNHLELGFRSAAGKKIPALAFFMTPEDFKIPPTKGSRIDLVATLEKSMFRSYPELRLRIVDII